MLCSWTSGPVWKRFSEHGRVLKETIGPAPGTNSGLQWHEILEPWNEQVEHFAALAGVKSWSRCAWTHFWKFATYVARLPSHRWFERVLDWSPPGPRNSGRPPHRWDHTLTCHCRYKILHVGWTLLNTRISFRRLHQPRPALSGISFLRIIVFVPNSWLFHGAACANWGPPCFWQTGSTRSDSGKSSTSRAPMFARSQTRLC